MTDAVQKLNDLHEVNHVFSSSDGPLTRLTIQILPSADIKDQIYQVCGDGTIESMITRDPTLEEAYLSIIK